MAGKPERAGGSADAARLTLSDQLLHADAHPPDNQPEGWLMPDKLSWV